MPRQKDLLITYEEWEASVDAAVKADRIWKMRVYRLACYAAEMGWPDARTLSTERLTREVAEQMVLALGSIRANLAEGYSRSPGRDRVRFFEYALGSTRECREWYRHGRQVLGDQCVSTRCDVLDEIARMLLAIIPRERDRKIDRASR